MCVTQSILGKRAKRTPDITVETTKTLNVTIFQNSCKNKKQKQQEELGVKFVFGILF